MIMLIIILLEYDINLLCDLILSYLSHPYSV